MVCVFPVWVTPFQHQAVFWRGSVTLNSANFKKCIFEKLSETLKYLKILGTKGLGGLVVFPFGVFA